MHTFVLLFATFLTTCNKSILLSTEESSTKTLQLQEAHIAPASIHYDGVERILFLDQQHIILVLNRDEELLHAMPHPLSVSLGSFSCYIKSLFGYAVPQRYEPEALKNARLITNEKGLDVPDTYLCSQIGGVALPPLRVTRQILSGGVPIDERLGPCRMLYYCYLKLPFLLKEGQEYVIAVKSGVSKRRAQVSFTYSSLRCISHALKVNQVGYLQGGRKYAYFGGYLQEWGALQLPNSLSPVFNVIDTTDGKIYFSGRAKGTFQDGFAPKILAPFPGEKVLTPFSGETVYELDFSDLVRPGKYTIEMPSVGRSWEFLISDDCYTEAAATAFRGFYHQRCGCAIGMPRSHWPRKACHRAAVYPSDAIAFIQPQKPPDGYELFDVIAATIDRTTPIEGVIGGWHDAADWDRNLHHYTCLFDLLFLYELNPHKFSQGQFNIPNEYGLPDLLEEILYGLKVWKATQTKEGAVSGLVETMTHPSIDDLRYPYALSRSCRWSALLFAAAAAHFSRLVQPFNLEMSTEYYQAALLSFGYGLDPKNSLGEIVIRGRKDRGRGMPYELRWQEKEENLLPFRSLACLQLYRTAKASNRDYTSFLLSRGEYEVVSEYAKRAWSERTPFQYSFWLYYLLAVPGAEENIGPEHSHFWRDFLIQKGIDELRFQKVQPYKQSWPPLRDYWLSWGMNNMANKAKLQIIAFELSQYSKNEETRRELLEGALRNLDYHFGCNPLGISWTTGTGSCYPVFLQHAVSEHDGIEDPIPGISPFGVDEGIPWYLTKFAWEMEGVEFIKKQNQALPLWRRFSQHQHLNTSQNEFSIHETVSSVAFCTLYFMKEGVRLKKIPLPREPDLLYGKWMVP